MKRIYFKSFRKRDSNTPLEISMFDPDAKRLSTCQTLDSVLKQRKLKTNTHHHTLPNRLSVSIPTTEFSGSYRSEGVLFVTSQKPSYCLPFDLMALTAGNKFNHEDYGLEFLDGYQKFIFNDFNSMISVFPNSKQAISALNDFRNSHRVCSVEGKMDYNEICFEQDIKIKPIALVGVSHEITRLGLQNNLPIYSSMNGHIKHINDPLMHPIRMWRELFYSGIGSMFDGYQGLAQN